MVDGVQGELGGMEEWVWAGSVECVECVECVVIFEKGGRVSSPK